MNNQKLLMFAVAGLLAPAVDAAADVHGGKVVTVIPSPVQDTAPTTGTPARLKKTDSEQPGNEHPSFALFGDGKTGIFFAATTELPATATGGAPRPANRRVQLSAVPFSLVQAADGSVEVAPDISKSKFVTNNNGSEYRQAHASTAFTADNGAAVCVQYNYQPQNDGDTKLYIQCFDSTGANKLAQTEAFAKNNDDCSMAETKPQLIDSAGGVERYVRWHGCNGNGRDDAWVGVFSLTKTANGYTYNNLESLLSTKVGQVNALRAQVQAEGNNPQGGMMNPAYSSLQSIRAAGSTATGDAIKAADVKTMKLSTANGADLMVKADGGGVMINDAKVVKTDVVCKNGVIHWVDTVLMPPAAMK